VKNLELKDYFKTVDTKDIPEQERVSKYKALIDRAKTLENEECLEVVERKDISITAIMSMMRKEGYKVTQRTVNGKKTLYIANKTEA